MKLREFGDYFVSSIEQSAKTPDTSHSMLAAFKLKTVQVETFAFPHNAALKAYHFQLVAEHPNIWQL